MIQKQIISHRYLFLFLAFGLFYSCRAQDSVQLNQTRQLIDSLIHVDRINEITILISFGSDAVTAIKTDKGIVLIDAGISTGLTNKYKKIIEDQFHSANFEYVINTHAHPDHNGGNASFYNTKIIGHENGLQEIADQWQYPEKVAKSIGKIVDEYEMKLKKCQPNTTDWYDYFIQKSRYQYAYYDAVKPIPIKQPDIKFKDSLCIDMGNVTFEMLYFGKCHSKSDIFIYVPELKLLFSGDLFFRNGYASTGELLAEDKVKWKKGIASIRKLMPNITTIISGHGEILSVDDLRNFNNILLNKCSN